jgi:hypothetical protein
MSETNECGAMDYPVWGDGTQERVTCSRPVRHEGSHAGLIGTHLWTWAFDERAGDTTADKAER